jgi:hypothetical protein
VVKYQTVVKDQTDSLSSLFLNQFMIWMCALAFNTLTMINTQFTRGEMGKGATYKAKFFKFYILLSQAQVQ